MISGHASGKMMVWNVVTGACDQVLECSSYATRALAVCGSRLVSGSGDGPIKVWAMSSCTMDVQEGRSNANLGFTPSGPLEADTATYIIHLTFGALRLLCAIVTTYSTSGAFASSRDALRADSDLLAYRSCHRRDGTAGTP